jgi:methylated-DNA-protein-cysteine methyltransferase-like protein
MPNKTANNFYQSVYKLVRRIPAGQVATYGQIAALLGKPRGARLVGWALRHCPADVPWQRVINHQGMLSIENLNAPKQLQAELLKAEGVKVDFHDHNFWVKLEQYLWRPRR